MTEESAIYERRADHGKRAALMRLRLIEAKVIPLLEAIGVGVVNHMRQTPPEGV